MSAPSDRRGFLRGLATLPLIGGGVTLIGNPTAAAEPVTLDLFHAYNTWLELERRYLCHECEALWPPARIMAWDPNNAGGRYHRYRENPPPSNRAAVVLSAVGCDWRAS